MVNLSRVRAALSSVHPLQRLFHFIFAKILFSLPQSVRRKAFYGREHYCPICESNLNGFMVLHRSYHLWCPVCRSLQRHRLTWLFFAKMQLFSELPKRMLHIAPEPGLTARILEIPGIDYVSIDLNDSFAMFKMDVTNIEYPNSTFDIIYCSHVLEHVKKDRKAISELQRVLKPNGYAVILVPIIGSKTIEASVTDPVEREKLFGQFDHVRSYGSDFKQRLEQVGFECKIFETEDIVKPSQISRLGLSEDENIFLCSK